MQSVVPHARDMQVRPRSLCGGIKVGFDEPTFYSGSAALLHAHTQPYVAI
eukprot:COSAG05_NODE_24473_length_251_cov_0.677632_1_plen_49_part_01